MLRTQNQQYEQPGYYDNEFPLGEYFLHEDMQPHFHNHQVRARVNPHTNGNMVVLYPGYMEAVNSLRGKYARLAWHMHNRVGAVVRTDNYPYDENDKPGSTLHTIEAVIQYALKHAKEIAGVNQEELSLHLFGFSSGGEAVAIATRRLPQVEKILLQAPAITNREPLKAALAQYKHRCSIIVGENDEEFNGEEQAAQYESMFHKDAKVKKLIVPNCNHRFDNDTEHGYHLTAAVDWAFCDSHEHLLNPANGIDLYGDEAL